MRKVLVITYYWPPAGGPGVQRWLKFVKYFRDYGIEPIVYIPENPHYPLLDRTLVDEVPNDLTIYRHKIFEPYGISKIISGKKTKRISSGVISPKNQSILERLMLWVRGNLFIPDARKFWIGPSVKFLKKVLEEDHIETIITTGPPHSMHLIGLELKKRYKLQWVADFRDPWTNIGYHKKLKLTSYAKKRHKKLEENVLNNADKIVVTSKTTKQEFEQITSKPLKVITNGYDFTAFKESVLDAKFTISHIGSMLTGRNPINLWKVLSELSNEHEDFKQSLQLNFIGVVGGNILNSIQKYGLGEHINVLGYISHEDAVKYQQKSQILLLVEIDSQETTGIIPGKLFEYLWARRPILGIGPSNWEVAEMVSETESGDVFGYDAHSELKDVILNWFQAYKNNSLSVSSTNIKKYSRRDLTRQLAEYI
ncbi:glycosyltransferase family 4 protein [Maribacter sp. PR1]|uniref:Glycosyltransferase family 4 protein n=1 Tax=Maribacter cobaltidurans TaxID=1178778 RepID=A0ABU7IX50_9FLAO|nr:MULTISPECIES: glycosyltransferase family 4 protein [Maribacter]MDC6389696.1 glycosyltransferase family 4 protein [Maribacter sp. PR1]MEE1977086.1 glycosyltransferase family 4 protein [Maribacter cobaltidurans]